MILPVLKARKTQCLRAFCILSLSNNIKFLQTFGDKFSYIRAENALQTEVAAFGINTTIVNPVFFRTELLTEQSSQYANNPIEDYDERREQLMQFWKGANG